MLHFLVTGDFRARCLAVHALRSEKFLPTVVSASDIVSRLELELRGTSLLHCNCFILIPTGLKERATPNETICEPEEKQGGKTAVEWLLEESHAKAKISSLAC